MFFSNRAVFQNNALPKDLLFNPILGTSSMSLADMKLERESIKVGNVFDASNALRKSGFRYTGENNFNQPLLTSWDTRPSTDEKIVLNFSMYVPQDYIDSVSDPSVNSAANGEGQQLFKHSYQYGDVFYLEFQPVAYLVGNSNVPGGQLHIGRTSTTQNQFDGWFLITLNQGGTSKFFKFPVNKSEIVNRWSTWTLAVSPTKTDFSNWMWPTGTALADYNDQFGNPPTLWARAYLTNSDGTYQMDYHNNNFYHDSYTARTMPWNLGTNGSDHQITYAKLFGNNSPYGQSRLDGVETHLLMSNFWLCEGGFFDPALYYSQFTQLGKPMGLSTPSVGGLTPQFYYKHQSAAEITTLDAPGENWDNKLLLTSTVGVQNLYSDFQTTGADTAMFNGGNPYA